MPGYVLAREADADLVEIARYTKRRWGAEQARRYRDRLLEGFEAMATGSVTAKSLDDLAPGMKMMRCEQHYIFCRFHQGRVPEIFAVLHKRMDMVARIAERLE